MQKLENYNKKIAIIRVCNAQQKQKLVALNATLHQIDLSTLTNVNAIKVISTMVQRFVSVSN
jgi:hypothetical protein